MHVAGLMGLALGPATCMNHQFTVATQAWGGDAQQPERRPLVQSKYDAFVTLAYHYNDVIMDAIASQITSLASVYSDV